MNGIYKLKYRSKNLQKYKTFYDSEFEIVGFKEGDGTNKGLIIFECKVNDSGLTVDVTPSFPFEVRKEMFKNGKTFIGKFLTVKYQNITDDGNLRFPIGLAIRDYE